MKKTRFLFFSLLCLLALSGCSGRLPANPGAQETAGQETPAPSPEPSVRAESDAPDKTPQAGQEDQMKKDTMPTVTIRAGGKSFIVTLYENVSARAFVKKLPLTLQMEELNGNEKFYYFAESFPTDSEQVENIHAGDLMLYGSDCLVLFYESFSTSYSYTKLGSVKDADGLADALGSGGVKVEFSANSAF